jgi:ribosome-binding factor A
MSRRTDRINGLLRREIAELLLHSMHDPRLAALVSVIRVNISPDLRYARVFVSIMANEEEKRVAMVGLQSAVPYLQRELAGRLTLRLVPQLSFSLDESIEEGDKVLRLMDHLAADKDE